VLAKSEKLQWKLATGMNKTIKVVVRITTSGFELGPPKNKVRALTI
jgi:hypothetical protein